ncbi:hypothetical protein SEA_BEATUSCOMEDENTI_50 [Arthrobacter phage BeatusComedenti]|uniref:Uncharacterized protein n=1 Tax=Arthrobacter phage BeatusComedenti TaxID=2656523 RepID=A0A649VX37_9CAUD|nr:hypothetical protein SEA_BEATUSCOMEDENTI_50 [Arthrobacter phage BeatusComedenti]
MTVVQAPGKNFGTSESGKDVEARELEPGVRVDGFFWNRPSTVVVQEVNEQEDRMQIIVADFTSGDVITAYLYKDRPVTAWGRI